MAPLYHPPIVTRGLFGVPVSNGGLFLLTNTRLQAFPSLLASGSSTTDGATAATAQFAPEANLPVYAALMVSNTGSSPPQPTASGSNLTWNVEKTIVFGANLSRLTLFSASGSSPVNGTLTFDHAGQQQNCFIWSVFQVINAETSGATLQVTGSSFTSDVKITGSLPLALENPNNVHIAIVGLGANNAVTPDPDFTELSDNTITGPSRGMEVEWATDHTVCIATFAAATNAMINVEVKSGT